jgi:hypothetical protein
VAARLPALFYLLDSRAGKGIGCLQQITVKARYDIEKKGGIKPDYPIIFY